MSNRTLPAITACPHCGGSLAPAPRKAGEFTGHDDFHAGLREAIARAIAELGADWQRMPGGYVWARVPAPWARYKAFRRTVAGRRDLTMPAARFWPAGTLPRGPDYATPCADTPADLHRRFAARCEVWRDDAREFALIAFRARKRLEFARWKHDARQHEKARLAALRYAAELEGPAAPEPVAAPAPAAPEPVAAPAPIVAPAPKPAPAKPAAAPADPRLIAWWQTAIASWRAYQSPDDAAALEQCQAAMRELTAALRVPSMQDHLLRAMKAGRAFPSQWF